MRMEYECESCIHGNKTFVVIFGVQCWINFKGHDANVMQSLGMAQVFYV